MLVCIDISFMLLKATSTCESIFCRKLLTSHLEIAEESQNQLLLGNISVVPKCCRLPDIAAEAAGVQSRTLVSREIFPFK